MCGRYTLTTDPGVIQQSFDLETVPVEMAPRYNVAPSQPVPVITNLNPRALTFVKWGLIPSWAKDPAMGSRMINARSETVEEKASFKHAFKRRRCLIPADGFYEWAKQDGKKIPYYIHLKDHALFAFAGLWETWHSPEGDEIQTCTILTTTPNEVVKPLHNRMAVILDRDDYDLWLSPDEMPPDALKPLLRPYPPDEMVAYPVSTQVNNPINDTPQCIEPYNPPQQPSLF